jgi:hypothetical protein
MIFMAQLLIRVSAIIIKIIIAEKVPLGNIFSFENHLTLNHMKGKFPHKNNLKRY